MKCQACGTEKVTHDCKSDYFKKNLSTDGAVKDEPKAEAPKDKDPKGEGSETEETPRSSV